MWGIFAVLGLLGIVLIARLWIHGELAAEGAQEGSAAVPPDSKSPSNQRVELHLIRYELTRWDFIANQMSMTFRNPVLRVFLLLSLGLIEWMVLSNTAASVWALLLVAITVAISLALILGIATVVIFGAVALFLRHRSVLGAHELEVTERGLLERTEFNENLVKWPGICRVRSTSHYLYISISDLNFYSIPKRGFAPEDIAGFEAAIRERMEKIDPPRSQELPAHPAQSSPSEH